MSDPQEGLLVEFDDEQALARACKHLRELGYRDLEAFTPFASEEVMEALELPKSRVPLVTLLAGLFGAGLGYFILWITTVWDYPLNVGGRPPHPWPAFIPITFETAVLFGGVCSFIAFFVFSRLPRLWHPVFAVPGFAEVTTDRFFLAVSSVDPRFDSARTTHELNELSPLRVVRFSGRDASEEERA
jgi:hypothetical protein